MPESAQQWYDRVRAAVDADGYREAPWPTWRTWPFDGAPPEVRPLEPPGVEAERGGAGGVDCPPCATAALPDPSAQLVWRDELLMIGVPLGGTPLPVCAFLMPRRHADLADLTTAEAARSGELLTAFERAAVDVLDVPRVHAARWGDGIEHLHWWLFARPTGMSQLRGTFVALWEELLPLRDQDEVRADLDLVAAALVDRVGGEALPRT